MTGLIPTVSPKDAERYLLTHKNALMRIEGGKTYIMALIPVLRVEGG